MSFLAELKQRRVVRVAMVYLVVAWVGVQVASIALPAFDAPPWALRFLILLFSLGFPLALLLAWALDLTPEGVRITPGKVGNKRMAFISLGLVVLALGWYFYGQPAIRKANEAPERSIAVMPFVNMSGNAANDYFSDGLAETTLDMLAQVPDLKVIARTSSFQFRGKNSDMREIGRTLGAAHLLEGSVQQAGDTVRITVQLIRAKDGSHVWSKRYDRKLTDVFKIQDEIATSVVDALAVNLTDSSKRRLVQKRTDNVAAYDAYLKGIALLPRRDVGEMRQALAHFERAIALDPTYAKAYVGAYDALHLLNLYGTIDDAARKKQAHYLERALALGPNLGEAHVSRAVSLEQIGKADEAILEYRRALELSPGYATGWQWMGELVAFAYGDYDNGLPLLAKARELDPLSPVINGTYLFHLAQSGKVEEALAAMNAAIAENPRVARSYDDRAVVHQMRGDLVATLRDYATQDRLDPKAYGFRSHRCFALLDFSALDEAEACLRPLAAQAPDSNFVLATQARLAYLRGDRATAERLLPHDIESGMLGYHAMMRIERGDARGALALYRETMPDVVEGSRPPRPGEAWHAVHAGIALMRTGEDARGRALVRSGMAVLSTRPYAAAVAHRGWIDVLGHEALGDRDAAIAALRQGVEAGFAQDIADLDVDPLLADLRRDPRYERTIAPARAMARAQVDAAREAGVL
jgi:adenylate cyclase